MMRTPDTTRFAHRRNRHGASEGLRPAAPIRGRLRYTERRSNITAQQPFDNAIQAFEWAKSHLDAHPAATHVEFSLFQVATDTTRLERSASGGRGQVIDELIEWILDDIRHLEEVRQP